MGLSPIEMQAEEGTRCNKEISHLEVEESARCHQSGCLFTIGENVSLVEEFVYFKVI